MSIGATTGVAAPLAPVVHEAAEATPLVQDGIDAAPITARGAEAGAVQILARPARATGEAQARAQEPPLAATDSARELTLPAVQLVPITLVGLVADPEVWWNLPRDPSQLLDPATDRDTVEPAPEDWRAVLAGALRAALAAPDVPEALQHATADWRIGRWVALACPRSADSVGAAWLFVVTRPSDESLAGLRLPARLRWFARPRAGHWVHTRLVKNYDARHGRELYGPADPLTGRVPCTIQFGPLLPPERADATVRIDQVDAMWATLDAQWSVILAVSAQPIGGGL